MGPGIRCTQLCGENFHKGQCSIWDFSSEPIFIMISQGSKPQQIKAQDCYITWERNEVLKEMSTPANIPAP